MSKTILPPNATLVEILNKAFDGPMMFREGIYVRVPVKETSKIMDIFIIEKRRHIKRVRNFNKDFNEIIVSFEKDDTELIKQKLSENNIQSDIFYVQLPLWCPNSEKQRQDCLKFWPMNNIIAVPQLPIDPISSHSGILERIISDKSVIIKIPNTDHIISTNVSDCTHCDGHINHGVLNALGEASKYSSENDSYLCTGLDVYCYFEPCVMCSMAMVHSRVGRLFFVANNPKYGGIISQAQIHSCPSINHRFRAFKLDTCNISD